MGSKEGPRHMNKPSRNKPRTQVVVADAPTAEVEQPVDLTPTERELELAVEQAQSIVDDAKLEADLTVTSGDAQVNDEQPTVEGGSYRVLPPRSPPHRPPPSGLGPGRSQWHWPGDSGQAERRCSRCQPAVGRHRQRSDLHSGRARECHLDLR
jgi:hypothetical protein